MENVQFVFQQESFSIQGTVTVNAKAKVAYNAENIRVWSGWQIFLKQFMLPCSVTFGYAFTVTFL